MNGVANSVWLVSELYYPELTSTGYFVTAIAEGLARNSRVSVLCGQPSYSARGTKAPRRESKNGVEIHRASSLVLDKNILIFKVLNLLLLSAALFFHACKLIRRGDTAIVVTNPPLLPFLISIACKLKRARCVLLIHDVYPNVLVASGLVEADNPVIGLMEQAVRWLYRGADHIITIGRDMASLAANKIDPDWDAWSNPSRMSIIPNWGEVDEIRPLDRLSNPILNKLGIQHKFVVQYAGNMGRSHDIEAVVACARLLRADSRFHFLMVGTGAKRSLLELEARDLPNVTVLDPLPRAERNVVLAACDISVIPFVPGMFGVSVPSRMYNVMASGRPMITLCDQDAEVAKVIREERIGWVLDAGDAKGMAEALLVSATAPRLLEEMGARARTAVERKYTAAHVLGRYESVVRHVAAA